MAFSLKHLKTNAAATLLSLAPITASGRRLEVRHRRNSGLDHGCLCAGVKSRIKAATNGDVTVTNFRAFPL